MRIEAREVVLVPDGRGGAMRVYRAAQPVALGCACDAPDGLGFLDKIVREVARPFKQVGREFERVYDKIEDAVKPYLAPLTAVALTVALGPAGAGLSASVTGALSAGASSIVGSYRQARVIEKGNAQAEAAFQAELRRFREEMPRVLVQRAQEGGLIVNASAVPASLRATAQALAQWHSESNYRAILVAAGDQPEGAMQSILERQNSDAANWQRALANVQPTPGAALVPPAAGGASSAMPYVYILGGAAVLGLLMRPRAQGRRR